MEPHCQCCQRESQWQSDLISRDGLMCEQHPGLEFEHDPDCAGPGMPWIVAGREVIAKLKKREKKKGGGVTAKCSIS